LLGWSGPDGNEFFSELELIEAFELSRINRANSIFNYVPGDPKNWTDAKAIHFNSTYIRNMPLEDLFPFVKEEMQREGLWRNSFESSDRQWFMRTIDLIRARFLTIKDFSTKGRCYFSDDFDFDAKALTKNLLKDKRLRYFLPDLALALERLESFSAPSIEKVIRAYAEEQEVSAGLLINAARTAVSGTSVGPGLFEMLEVIGRDSVVRRLRKAEEIIPES